MFFEYPDLLWLLTVPALLVLHYLYVELSGRRPHLRVSVITPWKRVTISVPGTARGRGWTTTVGPLSTV